MERPEIEAGASQDETVEQLTGDGTATLELREEELIAEKRLVQLGTVRIR